MSPESRKVAGAILVILPTVMIGGVSILTLLIGTPEYMQMLPNTRSVRSLTSC